MKVAISALTLISCALCAHPRALSIQPGQTRDHGLMWSLALKKCRPAPQRPCIFYGSVQSIEGELTLSNLTTRTINLPALAATIRIAVVRRTDNTQAPVSVQLGNAIVRRSTEQVTESPEVAIRLQPEAGLRMPVLIRFDSQASLPGDYRVTVEIGDVLSGATTADGARWSGRAARTGWWDISIVMPQNDEDRASFHQLEGSHLLNEGRDADALPHLQEWARLSPGNLVASRTVGHAYVRLGMHKEAVDILQPMLPTMLRFDEQIVRRSFVALLARAHMGLRQEDQARRVLQQGGYSAEEIERAIGLMKTGQ